MVQVVKWLAKWICVCILILKPKLHTPSNPHTNHSLTGVDRLVAGQVALVAEGGLAAVTSVGLVTVVLEHVALQGVCFGELAVTLVAEERVAF